MGDDPKILTGKSCRNPHRKKTAKNPCLTMTPTRKLLNNAYGYHSWNRWVGRKLRICASGNAQILLGACDPLLDLSGSGCFRFLYRVAAPPLTRPPGIFPVPFFCLSLEPFGLGSVLSKVPDVFQTLVLIFLFLLPSDGESRPS